MGMNSNRSVPSLPVAIIGAGPVGLAAAAHLHARGLDFLLFEAGAGVGAAVREWRHVRLFSPWAYNIDPAAAALLAPTGWSAPDPEAYPTGGDIVARYLEPLAAVPAIAARLRLRTRVTGVTRLGRDKMKTDAGRAGAPFRLRVLGPDGETDVLARAVIDAAGTWRTPNPLGADGIPARGERAHEAAIRFGIPDVAGAERARYAGRRVLVVGSGHSAFNALVDLAALVRDVPGTRLTWAVRRASVERVFGGGENDRLAAGGMDLVTDFRADAVERGADGLRVRAGARVIGPFDEIVVATGFRPDFSYLGELQLGLDPLVETTPALAPMIDPNLHSCGTVRPHGHRELAHPETGFYIVGMKSYGRAPTFLLRTGYEQVRSVAAALAGDLAAADRVELELPETGVCSVSHDRAADSGACCGGAPKKDATACCVKDEDARAAGEEGCGCGAADEKPASVVRAPEPAVAGACCR